MARAGRRPGEASDPSVKLFVASTGWPHKPTHTPKRPLVILYGATANSESELKSDGGPCRCYAEMACAVLQPDHDCLFMIDLSEVAAPSDWQAEIARPGRATRMLERWFAKFNPREATVVALGDDAELWAPLLRLNDEQRVSRLIAAGRTPSEHLAGRLAAASVETVQLESGSSLQTISEAVARGGGQSELGASDLFFVFVEFDIDKRSKQLVWSAQNITSVIARSLASKAVSGASGRGAVATSSAENGTSAAEAPATNPLPAEVLSLLASDAPKMGSHAVEGVATHHLCAGMSFAGLVVQVLSCNTDSTADALRVELADSHGCVEAVLPKSMQATVARGKSIAISGRVVTAEGKLLIAALQVQPHRGLRDGYQAAQEGQRNVSEFPRRFGCLVMRGRKCVLARSQEKNIYVPADEPHTHETPEQAATRAVAEACDIFPEEIALLRDVPPAIIYDPEGAGFAPVAVVTIFAALAISQPPAGSRENEDTVEDEDDLYDWFPFEQAISRLASENEKEVLARLARDVAAAIAAGVVVPEYPCSFGPREPVQPAQPPPPPPVPAPVPAIGGYPAAGARRSRADCPRGGKRIIGARFGPNCDAGCC